VRFAKKVVAVVLVLMMAFVSLPSFVMADEEDAAANNNDEVVENGYENDVPEDENGDAEEPEENGEEFQEEYAEEYADEPVEEEELELSEYTVLILGTVYSIADTTSLEVTGDRVNDITNDLIAEIGRLVNLTELVIDGQIAVDFEGLEFRSDFWDAVVTGNENVSVVVETVTRDGNPVSFLDMSPFEYLTELVSLQLTQIDFYDASPLSYLTNLTNLSIVNTHISDLSFLSGMTNLEQLELSNNLHHGDWLGPLAYLTSLQTLELLMFLLYRTLRLITYLLV